MDRRALLQRLGIAVPGLLLLPPLLSSCKDTELVAPPDFDGKVLIVGAGAAGLYAAYLLDQQGIDVTLLEAAATHGGRIRPLRGFSDFPIELGAEEIHGKRTIWYDLIQSTGAETAPESATSDLVFIGGTLMPESDIEDADLEKLQKLIEEIEDYEGADVNFLEWAQANGIAERLYPILNAVTGNEFGTSMERLSALEVARADAKWTAGPQNLLLGGDAHLDLLDSIFAPILDKILYNKRVTAINTEDAITRVTDIDGTVHEADKVIVTVPLTVLADGDIHWKPELPAPKLNAAKTLGMGAGMKIILKFNNRFWPEDLGSIIGGEVIPEFWSTGTGRSAANNVLTAFVHGASAETLSAMGNDAIAAACSQLDVLYERSDGTTQSDLADAYIMDWTTEPHIRGTYSYPTVGSGGMREVLAESLNNKLYFAGEATNTMGHFATVHGAMESAGVAVREILQSISK